MCIRDSNYGAKNRARMIQAVKIAAVIACSVMFVGMLLFLTIPGTLLSLSLIHI